MRSHRIALVLLQSVFIVAGLAMLAAPLVAHGGDPRTYAVGLLYGGLLVAGFTLSLVWAVGMRLKNAPTVNFSLVSMGILSSTGMALTYGLLPGFVGLAYFCCSVGMMESGDLLEDARRVEGATAPPSRKTLVRPPLSSLARKAAWTASLVATVCILSAVSLVIVFDARGVLASTLLAFLTLALLGWLAYNLASGEAPDTAD